MFVDTGLILQSQRSLRFNLTHFEHGKVGYCRCDVCVHVHF